MTKEEIYEKLEKGDYIMRSCWECNSAHERLKECEEVIYCIWCNSIYYKGECLNE